MGFIPERLMMMMMMMMVMMMMMMVMMVLMVMMVMMHGHAWALDLYNAHERGCAVLHMPLSGW